MANGSRDSPATRRSIGNAGSTWHSRPRPARGHRSLPPRRTRRSTKAGLPRRQQAPSSIADRRCAVSLPPRAHPWAVALHSMAIGAGNRFEACVMARSPERCRSWSWSAPPAAGRLPPRQLVPSRATISRWRLGNQEHRRLMRLLVVEDNNDLAQLLLKGLGAEGFAADVVTTAGEARAALATTRYAAVMLDLGLPDGDGLAVLRELRERKD